MIDVFWFGAYLDWAYSVSTSDLMFQVMAGLYVMGILIFASVGIILSLLALMTMQGIVVPNSTERCRENDAYWDGVAQSRQDGLRREVERFAALPRRTQEILREAEMDVWD